MRHTFKLVLFDFDYTLVDSSKGVIQCINYALKNMGYATVSDEVACRTIGISLKETFVLLSGDKSTDKINEYVRLFTEHADQVMTDLTKLYQSVPQTTAFLKQNGIKLGIISGKYRYRIEEILGRDGILQYFDKIIGGEDVAVQKPSPEGLFKVISHFNVKPKEVLYVGDSLTDAKTVKDTGVIFAAVLTGVTEKVEFEPYKVHRYINDISELMDMIAETEMAEVV